MLKIAIFSLATLAATAAVAKSTPEPMNGPTTYDGLMALPVPVTDGTITDRKFCELGPVKKEVRKATIFSGASSPEKVRREIWESAKKKGADAVINYTAGNSRITGISWGATPVAGTMVKFPAAGAGCS